MRFFHAPIDYIFSVSPNVLDIILAVGLGWSAYKGWRTGMVRSLIGLAGLLLAYVASFYYGQAVGAALFDDAIFGTVTGIGIVFAAALIVFHLLGRMARTFLHATALGVIDGIFGGALGLLKAVLVLGLLLILAHTYPLHAKIPELIETSQLAQPVQSASLLLIDGIRKAIPEVRHFIDQANIDLPGKAPPVVDTLTDGASEASRKIEEIVNQSKERLEAAK